MGAINKRNRRKNTGGFISIDMDINTAHILGQDFFLQPSEHISVQFAIQLQITFFSS